MFNFSLALDLLHWYSNMAFQFALPSGHCLLHILAQVSIWIGRYCIFTQEPSITHNTDMCHVPLPAAMQHCGLYEGFSSWYISRSQESLTSSPLSEAPCLYSSYCTHILIVLVTQGLILKCRHF